MTVMMKLPLAKVDHGNNAAIDGCDVGFGDGGDDPAEDILADVDGGGLWL